MQNTHGIVTYLGFRRALKSPAQAPTRAPQRAMVAPKTIQGWQRHQHVAESGPGSEYARRSPSAR